MPHHHHHSKEVSREVIRGEKGEKGDKGERVPRGHRGEKGEKGRCEHHTGYAFAQNDVKSDLVEVSGNVTFDFIGESNSIVISGQGIIIPKDGTYSFLYMVRGSTSPSTVQSMNFGLVIGSDPTKFIKGSIYSVPVTQPITILNGSVIAKLTKGSIISLQNFSGVPVTFTDGVNASIQVEQLN